MISSTNKLSALQSILYNPLLSLDQLQAIIR